MLYYLFSCKYCQTHATIKGQQNINEIIEKGFYRCSCCNWEEPYDNKNVYDDDQPETHKLYGSTASYWGIKNDEMPTIKDMEVFYEDFEEMADWQRLIIEEFETSEELTWDDKKGFHDALCQLKSHQFGWVKFGVWAFQFKVKRFYKHHYRTWSKFCEKELHQTHWYIDKIIKAARVIKDLICAGFTVLPQNEYQCRPLTKFWGEELIDNWSMIVDAVEPHLITSDLIKSRFCSREPRDEKWFKVDGKTWEEFEFKARSRGLDPKQKLQEILEDWEATEDEEPTDELDDDDIEDVPIEKLELWQADLQALIEEKDRADNWFTKLILWSFTNDRASPVSSLS
ncbi:hypothetical protein [Cyanothece sp. BG0011]|uniref:hypothetical protein n=1 Tax=Cyanothece sp. BG0011 TaxID=2082950 RepID=UPI0018E4F7F9|nr:hypothetical protein [Cyanothece sp. BG0011]